MIRKRTVLLSLMLGTALIYGCGKLVMPNNRFLHEDVEWLQPEHGAATQPNYADLTIYPVIGELGYSLGTVSTIRAVMIAGIGGTATKDEASGYFLLITDIDARHLSEPLRMQFVQAPGADIPNNLVDLALLKTGKPISRLSETHLREIENEYLGKEMRLQVFETGLYSGVPLALPKDIRRWQEPSFGFSTSLVALRAARLDGRAYNNRKNGDTLR